MIKFALSMRTKGFLLYGLTFLSGLYCSYVLYNYIHENHAIFSHAKHEAVLQTQQAAEHIDTMLKQLEDEARDLAHMLSTTKPSREQIIERLQQKPSTITGLGIAFAPYAFDSTQEFFAPYVVTLATHNKLFLLQDLYDYTQQSRYKDTIATGPQFFTTYLDRISNTLIVEFAMPFYHEQTVAGVVFANYKIPYIQEVINTLPVSQKGFISVISNMGRYTVHPNRTYIVEKQSAFDLAKNDTATYNMITKATQGQQGSINTVSPITQQDSWIFYAPLTTAHWSLISTIVKNDLNLVTPELYHAGIHTILAFFCFLMLLGLSLLKVQQGGIKTLWIASVIVSLCLLGSIIALWYTAARNTQNKIDPTLQPMYSPSTLATYMQEVREKFKRHHLGELEHITMKQESNDNSKAQDSKNLAPAKRTYHIGELIEIPTGMYLAEIEFNKALGTNKVELVGNIWQRYKIGKHDHVRRGILIPQASDLSLKKIYQFYAGDEEVIGWRVHAVILQDFDYSRYPFDPKVINLKIWPLDFGKSIVLTPDLPAYKTNAPSSLPQISTKIHSALPEWHLEKSFFGFRNNFYLTNYGYYSPDAIETSVKSEIPDLYINILLRRYIISSLILNLIPIIIIILLLFLVLVMTGLNLLKAEHILASVASLFFTAMLAYTQFQSELPIQYVVFLAYFYPMLEVIILLVSIITIMYALKFKLSVLTFDNLLIPQILYWPFVLGFSLILSLVYFY